jgi:predicted DNA-binding transcriptional regulator AlpA
MNASRQSFAEPQARLDELRMRAVRAGGTAFADLGYANAWDGASAELKAALHAAVDVADPLGLQYTPYGGATVARLIAAPALPLIEVALFLDLPVSTLDKLRAQGRGPRTFKIGRRLYVRQADLRRWLDDLADAAQDAAVA